MRSDADILDFSVQIPGYYDRDELGNLIHLVRRSYLPKGATIVEIGVEFGRSASIFLQCPEAWDKLYLIDNRSHSQTEGMKSTRELIEHFGSQGVYNWNMDSLHAVNASDFKEPCIDLLHIDADHGDGIYWDCDAWLPKLKIGGIVVFHDYQRKGADPTTGSVFPSVDLAVDWFTGPNTGYEDLGTVNTQAVRRKLAETEPPKFHRTRAGSGLVQ